ncbi:AMP-binding protein [Candidatus Halocynthiibacter alkanivorans]|uniref:AMP-binding protein n=1 Tax=Candidatus Halocynthiibacter alkanivorans TaxID=2267619 RepID=UPI000DF39B78|nr:AMP-binding protein [Candidatus Halocynthiibacter alkanivorans]
MHKNFDALPRTAANYVALTPLSFLSRAAGVFGDREAVSYGDHRYSWSDVERRCQAFASALVARGIGLGDTVSVIAPNIPALFELHYAVPMTGAVLNTINSRLEAETIAYILDHADSQLVIADSAYAPLLRAAFDILGREIPVIDIIDDQAGATPGFGQHNYEDMIASGDGGFAPRLPADEWQALALNYTSGTSGKPKGVVYHHRGAYLMSMGTIAGWNVPQNPVYLSVVPMFHCNGWNHPWAMAMVGARMVFTRDALPQKLFRAIKEEGVTHFGAAPVILAMLADSEDAPEAPFSPPLKVFTAGAPPPPAVLAKTRALGFEVMQVYGLTETYGHVSQCIWREEWDALSADEQAEMQAMQGVGFPMVEGFAVVDRATGGEVPKDGKTQGEIAIRGNVVMKGYYKDATATAAAFENGQFWSGDGAVVHANSYVQIKDRLKDVIISGGENISSVEVENALHHHPAIAAVAVVAMPHPKWGESPCAFVELRSDAAADEAGIIAFCKERLAGFKVPKAVVFGDLPKTATGKIQKFLLRERAREMGKDKT